MPLTPKSLAEHLTAFFLENGNFVATGPMSLQPIPATAQRFLEEEGQGFAGLAVQSVGYTVFDRSVDADELDDQERPGAYVYVARGSKRFINSLPERVRGVACTVQNIGRLYVKPHQASVTTHRGNLYERGGRIACGSSCAPTGRDYAGTFGALVRKNSGGPLFAISNNHVFADCNHTPVGLPILSPSGIDGRPGMSAPRELCRHSEIVELRSGAPTLVTPCREDLAIAEVPDPHVVSSWQGDDQDGYDTPVSVTVPRTGLPVKKFGRTTGLTYGTMQTAQYRLHIPYDSEFFRALVWFQGVWTVRSNDSEPFALGGDSGSLVVTADGKGAVGILFATATRGTHGFIVPIDIVCRAFGGISLVGGHGV